MMKVGWVLLAIVACSAVTHAGVTALGTESPYSDEGALYGGEGPNGYTGGEAEGGYNGYSDGGHGGSKGYQGGGQLGGPYAYLGSHGLPEIEEYEKPFWKTSDNVDEYPDIHGNFHGYKVGPWKPLVITKPTFVKDEYAEKPQKEVREKKPKIKEPPVHDITEKPDISYPKIQKPTFVKDIYAVKPQKEVLEKKPKVYEPPVKDITEKMKIDYPGIQKPVFEKDIYAEKPLKPVYEKKPKYKEEPVPDMSEDTKHVYKGHHPIQKGGHAGYEGGYQPGGSYDGGYQQGGEGSYHQYEGHPMA